MSSLKRQVATAALAVAAFVGSGGAYAQGIQVLDSVDAFGSTSVLGMGFRDPLPRIDFQSLDVGVTSVVSCQRAITQGLYCLDGPILRYWPNTNTIVAGVVPDIDILDCSKDLAFGSKKPNFCTSVTVDYGGAIWLALRKSSSHSLVKVVARGKLGTACAATGPWYPLAQQPQDEPHPPRMTTEYCAREYALGLSALADVSSIDGELAAAFTPLGAGILGLVDGKSVVFFPDALDGFGNPLPPVPLASGKTAWGLIGNEQLLSAALLQFGATGSKQNYLLATTTLGRVLARNVAGSQVAFKVFDIVANRTDPAIYSRCNGDTAQYYGIRVSSQSERVYISDRDCGQVIALNWRTSAVAGYPVGAGCDAGTAATTAFCLVNARERETATSPEKDVTIATVSSDTAVSPDGVSIAPGIGIDLADCAVGKTCTLVADGIDDDNEFAGATLTGVVREGPASLMTVFQVKGIPDCREWMGPGCVQALIKSTPQGEYLDVGPLLPIEVTDQFAAGTLPEMLISPHYRGQGNPARFDAFVGIPEPGVQFRETFVGSFDVADLAGTKLGCGGTTTSRPDLNVDIVTTVSEAYGSVGGPTDDPTTEHADMLVNTGCTNPTQIAGGRWSLYAYNLKPHDDGNDGYYATLMRSLYADLRSAQDKTACTEIDIADVPGDPSTTTPALSPATCANLTTKWESANVMLERCINSSTYPRQSEAVNNCNSFLSQFAQYESVLEASQLFGIDPANRRGELEVRTQVIRYMFTSHFIPSIPPNGFEDL